MLDERIAAYDPIKAAEVLRDIRDEYITVANDSGFAAG